MKKLLALLLCIPLLAACSAQPKETITVYNWEDYINPDVLAMFEEETGIRVEYVNFSLNENMYAMMANSNASYDVVVPSDYMIERLIAEKLVQPLDMAQLPNFQNNFDWLRTPDYDPSSQYSVPYMWGTVGILYNTDMVDGEITSWGAMWDPQYERNVLMMDSVRDTLGITLKYLGYDMNTRELAHLEAARDKLIEQRQSNVVLAYAIDESKDKMVGGEAAMALVWSGDAMYSMEKAENLAYVVPEEGSNVWVDGMCIPKSATNIEGAHKFINFMMRPDVAALNSEYIGYSTPNAPALDILGDEYKNDPTFNPPQDVIDRCQFFKDIGENIQTYEYIWQEVTSSAN